MSTKTGRQSGIELLRIFSMLGVVLMHYNNRGGFEAAMGSGNLLILFFLESLFICAVDVYILISGYFLSGSQRRAWVKPLELIVQFILFKQARYLLSVVLGAPFSWQEVFYRMLPDNYFVILYSVLYLISPYLNRVFAGFTKEQWRGFLGMLLVIFSLWPTAVDLLGEIQGQAVPGISSIGYAGSQQGFTIVNFVLLYFAGAYLRFRELPKILGTRKKQILTLTCSTLLIFLWSAVTAGIAANEVRVAWAYHNPLVILSAASAFALFRSFSFSSRAVNALAGGAFTCFLFHTTLLSFFPIRQTASGSVPLLLGTLALLSVGCYLISYIVYRIYSWCTGWFFRWLEKQFPFFQAREY